MTATNVVERNQRDVLDPTVFTCRFCDHLSRGDRQSPDWTVVAETDNFVAVPSIGALIPGWLLVLPKAHVLSFAKYGVDLLPEIEQEIATLAASWASVFGPVSWFEHGPCEPSSAVGCSVDHAHMHLVPAGDLDLLSGARRHLPQLAFTRVENLTSAAGASERRQPYLYLRTTDNASWLTLSEEIPSQAFRRVIASLQGRPAEYDWKVFPQYATVVETLERATARG